MYGDLEIRVIITNDMHEQIAHRYVVTGDEAREFGLYPIPKPFSRDPWSIAEYQKQMDRRKKHSERLGDQIALSLQKYLEGKESHD